MWWLFECSTPFQPPVPQDAEQDTFHHTCSGVLATEFPTDDGLRKCAHIISFHTGHTKTKKTTKKGHMPEERQLAAVEMKLPWSISSQRKNK